MRALTSFCESLDNYGHLQESKRDYHVTETSTVDCISSADNSSHNKIDDSNRAAEFSEVAFEPKEVSQLPTPQPELEKQFHQHYSRTQVVLHLGFKIMLMESMVRIKTTICLGS